MIENWELIADVGYTFEFEHKDYIHVKVTIFTTKGEKRAWQKLKVILSEKN